MNSKFGSERQSAGTTPPLSGDRAAEEEASGAVAPPRLVRFWYFLLRVWYALWHRRPMSGRRASALMSGVYDSLDILGAPPDLLASVGSFRDTLNDEDVLACIIEWNQLNRSRKSDPSLSPVDCSPDEDHQKSHPKSSGFVSPFQEIYASVDETPTH